jgi:hypothetical protein
LQPFKYASIAAYAVVSTNVAKVVVTEPARVGQLIESEIFAGQATPE